MPKGIRTKNACGIAKVDPARFNEMVHAGYFKCAPETRPGSARMFDLDQTVTLKIFGELLSLSISPARAGQLACAAYKIFADQQNVREVVVCRNAWGEWGVEHQTPFAQMNIPKMVRLVFNIAEMREHISDLIESEQASGNCDE